VIETAGPSEPAPTLCYCQHDCRDPRKYTNLPTCSTSAMRSLVVIPGSWQLLFSIIGWKRSFQSLLEKYLHRSMVASAALPILQVNHFYIFLGGESLVVSLTHREKCSVSPKSKVKEVSQVSPVVDITKDPLGILPPRLRASQGPFDSRLPQCVTRLTYKSAWRQHVAPNGCCVWRRQLSSDLAIGIFWTLM
jgi:hypothetical protein